MTIKINDCKEDRTYCGLCKFWKNSQYLVGYCAFKGHNTACSDETCEKFEQEK